MKCIALVVVMALVAVNAAPQYPYTYGLSYAYKTLGLPIVPETFVAPPALPLVSEAVIAPSALPLVSAPLVASSAVRLVAPSPYVATPTVFTAPVVPAIKYADYVNPPPFVELKSIVAPQPIQFKSVAAPKPIEEPAMPEPAMPEIPTIEE